MPINGRYLFPRLSLRRTPRIHMHALLHTKKTKNQQKIQNSKMQFSCTYVQNRRWNVWLFEELEFHCSIHTYKSRYARIFRREQCTANWVFWSGLKKEINTLWIFLARKMSVMHSCYFYFVSKQCVVFNVLYAKESEGRQRGVKNFK